MAQHDLLSQAQRTISDAVKTINNIILEGRVEVGSEFFRDQVSLQSTSTKITSKKNTHQRKYNNEKESQYRSINSGDFPIGRILTKKCQSKLVQTCGRAAGYYVNSVIEDTINKILEDAVKSNKKKFIFPRGENPRSVIIAQKKVTQQTPQTSFMIIDKDGNKIKQFNCNKQVNQPKLEVKNINYEKNKINQL